MRRNVYTVGYRMYQGAEEKICDVIATSKEEAYEQATFYDIPIFIEKEHPYSTWVKSVTYQNGNCIRFNTHEGKPY